jgi:hypothetical protein
MKRKTIFLLIIALFLFLLTTSCALDSIIKQMSGNPKIINYPEPKMTINMVPFANIGCNEELEDGIYLCDPDSTLAELGCDEIKLPSPLFGGLIPNYPIALCMERTYDITDTLQANPKILDENEYIYNYYEKACLKLPLYVHYVIYKDGGYQLIRTKDDLKSYFAPINSPEESLSYALTLNNWSAYYGIKIIPNYKYYVPILEDTHIDELSVGYEVNLYTYQECGCGPHWTTEYHIKIHNDGANEIVSEEHVYRDLSEDELCRD